MIQEHLVEFLLSARISHFSRSSVSFHWRMIFEMKIWMLIMLVISGV